MASRASGSAFHSANELNKQYQAQVAEEQREHGYQWKSQQILLPDNKVAAIATAVLQAPLNSAPGSLPRFISAAPAGSPKPVARIATPPSADSASALLPSSVSATGSAISRREILPSVIEGASRAPFVRYVTVDEEFADVTTSAKLLEETSLAALDGLRAQEKEDLFRKQAEQRMKEGLDSVSKEFDAPLPTQEEYRAAYNAIPAIYLGPDAVAGKAFDGAGICVKATDPFIVNFDDNDPKAQATDSPYAVHQIQGGRKSQDDAYLTPTEIRFSFRGKELTATIAGVFDGSGAGSIRLAQFFANHLPGCVTTFLERLAPTDPIEDAIPQALTSAFAYLSRAYKLSYPTASGDLSTAVCVLKFGSKIYCANSGDSRALLVKKESYIPLNASDTMQNPLMRKLTKAPVAALNSNGQPFNGQGDPVFRAGYSFKRASLTTGAMETIYGKHEVGRLIGTISDLCSLPPAITLNDCDQDDIILLSSDGLFPGAATLEQGADAVRNGFKTNTKLSCIAEKMTTAASEAWNLIPEFCDNTTVMIWRL